MLGMWQRGDVARCVEGVEGDLGKAIGSIKTKVLLMPCETDQYFRPYVSEREQKSLRDGTVAVVPSIWGHIVGGGADKNATAWMDSKPSSFLSQ